MSVGVFELALGAAALLCSLVAGLVFTFAVVIYTAYGGFRAVVWTDVMQGFVMVGGVVLMLPLALYAVGGLGQATDDMAKMTPPEHGSARVIVGARSGSRRFWPNR